MSRRDAKAQRNGLIKVKSAVRVAGTVITRTRGLKVSTEYLVESS
ncbi:hypothetical protein [Daejeonella sp.]|nr:hypothetical protein [Daejeonella sp.]